MAPVNLPPEIIQRIILLLTRFYPPDSHPKNYKRLPNASQYASVSRFWQNEIERETFAELRLDLHRLSELNTIVTPRRHKFVQKIKLHIRLPLPGPRGDPETDDEKLQNDRVLQATFEAFLLSLSQWDTAEAHQGGIKLLFFAPVPRQERNMLTGNLPSIRFSAWGHKYRKSVLELTNPERIAQLPSVTAITKLEMNDPYAERGISIVAASALVAKLPAVKDIVLDWWKVVRFARMRNDIADALTQIKHPIDRFVLHSSNFETIDLAYPSPSTPKRLSEEDDMLSKSIHVLSLRAKSVDIWHIAISDEIFFPQALYTGIAEPRWDRLVDFTLQYLPIDHSGELLFLPDPYRVYSSDSEFSGFDGSEASVPDLPNGITEKSIYSLNIATPAIQKLYLNAARAALQMPVLKEMNLQAELSTYEYWHKFDYFIHGGSATATWTSSSGFVPEDNVLESWKKVPRKYLGIELEVKISDEEWAVR